VLRNTGTVVPIDVVWRRGETTRIRVLSLRYDVSAIEVECFQRERTTAPKFQRGEYESVYVLKNPRVRAPIMLRPAPS
jgi:hypothetical protein